MAAPAPRGRCKRRIIEVFLFSRATVTTAVFMQEKLFQYVIVLMKHLQKLKDMQIIMVKKFSSLKDYMAKNFQSLV